ncbi:Uncharacterized protein APZ42_032818 [Daphnia magna]|uniref:Uncharacterized protein n=1 Tax=Daphnia magna TaxID=35525 RepID=A0A164LV95_9CRUS|nr:Uncharacterized protein APZ42_032818 [Daphnia magna]
MFGVFLAPFPSSFEKKKKQHDKRIHVCVCGVENKQQSV